MDFNLLTWALDAIGDPTCSGVTGSDFGVHVKIEIDLDYDWTGQRFWRACITLNKKHDITIDAPTRRLMLLMMHAMFSSNAFLIAIPDEVES